MVMSGQFLVMLGQDAATSQASQTFVDATAIGLLPSFLFSADSCYLRNNECKTIPFVINVCCGLGGIVIARLFINVFGMELWGAGLSLAIANWARLIGLYAYWYRFNPWPAINDAFSFTKFTESAYGAFFSPGMLEFVKLALPSAALMWCGWWVYELQAIFAGWLGVEYLAAHVVCCNVEVTIFMIPLGIQQAASTLVGNAIGAEKPFAAVQFAQLALMVTFFLSLIIAYILVTYRASVSSLYSIDPRVVTILNDALVIVGVYHILDAINCVMQGVLRGLKMQGEAVSTLALGMVVYQLPVSFLLSKRLALNGIWLAAVSSLILIVWAYSRLLGKKFDDMLN